MKNYYIGVMSGTSFDGIDIALVGINDEIDNKTNVAHANIRLIASHCYSIPDELKQKLQVLCQEKHSTLQNLGEIDHQLGLLYSNVINQFIDDNNIARNTINAIGCHGQTVFHAPVGDFPFTMQIGDANIIAAKTGITTIADFRRKDMAFGGQGAPLVPAFHQAIFGNSNKNHIILNIGGIGNITALIPNHEVIGFDTGPGNVLLDGWIDINLKQPYDKDGNWAKTGTVSQQLLTLLLSDPYFQLAYPKSTGRELFNLNWLTQHLQKFSLSPQDIQATLVALTVNSIVNELNKLPLLTDLPCELIVCGGGAQNSFLLSKLAVNLPGWLVSTSDKQGISSDYMEAMAFAWLAYCRLNNIPSNITTVTGASKAVSLGVIYPA